MAPEELEELRALVGRLNCTAYDENLAVVLGAALEHIDQQATALDEAEALIRKNADMINGYLARITELESQILHQTAISACRIEELDRLQKQIAALQEIAVELKAEELYPYTMPSWEHLPEEDFQERILGTHVYREYPGKKEYRNAANRMLAEEHPEAFR